MSDGARYVYVAYITLRNGKRLYASHYGKKAFRIRVKDDPNQLKLI